MKQSRTYTREFKLKVLQECENGKGKAQLSREHGLHPSLITKWEEEYIPEQIRNSLLHASLITKLTYSYRVFPPTKQFVKESLEAEFWGVGGKSKTVQVYTIKNALKGERIEGRNEMYEALAGEFPSPSTVKIFNPDNK